MCQSVPANPCGPELVKVQMPVLQLCETRDFGIACTANKLKPTNCAAHL
jgi:hypothetical protein